MLGLGLRSPGHWSQIAHKHASTPSGFCGDSGWMSVSIHIKSRSRHYCSFIACALGCGSDTQVQHRIEIHLGLQLLKGKK